MPADPAEYVASRDVAAVLRPFKVACEMLQGGESPAAMILPVLTALSQQLQEDQMLWVATDVPNALEQVGENMLHPLAQQLRTRLREHISLQSRHIEAQRGLLLVASFLDPRFRSLKFVSATDTSVLSIWFWVRSIMNMNSPPFSSTESGS